MDFNIAWETKRWRERDKERLREIRPGLANLRRLSISILIWKEREKAKIHKEREREP